VIHNATIRPDQLDLLGRTPVPSDSDGKLLADIKTRGMKNPVLVIKDGDETYRLVDGLRRLAAYGPKDLIEVVYADTLPETYAILKTCRDEWQQPYTARRLWDLHMSTFPQVKIHVDINRNRNYTTRAGKPRGRKRENNTRYMMVAATGMSAHQVQCVLSLYGRAYGIIPEQEEYLPLIKEFVVRMDEGENPYVCDRELRELRQMQGQRIVGSREQRQVLEQSARTANGVIKILDQIATINDRISPEEALRLAGEYRALRTATYKIYKKLMERVAKAS
jgi:hypothetical protein